MAGELVIGDGIVEPDAKTLVLFARLGELGRIVRQHLVIGIAEPRRDVGDHGRVERQRAVLDRLPFLLDLATELLRAELMDENLDAGLVDIVAPAVLIVGAQDRFDIAEKIALRQERLDGLGDERRSAEPAADHDLEAGLAGAIAMHPQPDIVHLHRRAVVRRCRERDLELARQEGEFRVQRQMLAQQFRPDARILDLVGRDAGPLIGGDVTHAIAAGLHPVQSGARQIGHGVGQFIELDPVELDVLPRGEMAVVAVVAARNMRQHAQLVGGERAVGDSDPQHIGVQLQIDPIHEPQRLEFLFRQFAGQAAIDLVAELVHPLGHQRAVEIVVKIHERNLWAEPLVGTSDCARVRQRDGWSVGADLLAQIAGEHALLTRQSDRRDIRINGPKLVGERGGE